MYPYERYSTRKGADTYRCGSKAILQRGARRESQFARELGLKGLYS